MSVQEPKQFKDLDQERDRDIFVRIEWEHSVQSISKTALGSVYDL